MIQYRARCMLLTLKLKKSSCLCGCVGLEEGEEGAGESRGCQKDLQFPKEKTLPTTPLQTERMFQQQASKTVCLFFLLGICVLPYLLEKNQLFLQVQVLSLITFDNNNQPLLSTYLKAVLSM